MHYLALQANRLSTRCLIQAEHGVISYLRSMPKFAMELIVSACIEMLAVISLVTDMCHFRAVSATSIWSRKAVICTDGCDLSDALNRELPLITVLERKVRRAAAKGMALVRVLDPSLILLGKHNRIRNTSRSIE